MHKRYTLFLDFDGVLVTKFSTGTSKYNSPPFDPVCIENLKGVIKEIISKYGGITIIVISSWRYDLSDNAIVDILLNESGLIHYLSEIDILVLDRKLSKEQGIRQYIRENRLALEQCVILEDEYLGEELASCQIRTRSEDGIRGIDTLEGII